MLHFGQRVGVVGCGGEEHEVDGGYEVMVGALVDGRRLRLVESIVWLVAGLMFIGLLALELMRIVGR
jgi:hypothetical protein